MAPASASVPVSEIGHVTGAGGTYGGYFVDDGEEAKAWVWPESVRTANKMRRSGPIATVLSVVTQPIRRPGVFIIDPQGADPAKVLTLAEDLDLPILGMERQPPLRRKGRFSSRTHIRLALLKFTFGHMPFEIVCDPDILKATGQARLKKLAPRFPTSIAEIKAAPDGGLESITQHWDGGKERPRPIPVDNLVFYDHEREGAAWQGRSGLRPCYGSWLRLDRMLRARAYLMERQSMGLPVGEAPEGATQDVIDLMGELAQQSRAGDQSGIGIPHGASIHLVGVKGTLPDVTAAILDERAMLADLVMAAWLRLGTQEASGNRALGSTFVDQFAMAEDSIAADIADVQTQHVVEDLWDWNYGSSEPAPAVVTKPFDAERDISVAELVELIKVGAVTPDESIEDLLRQKGKLPKRTAPEPGSSTAANAARSLAIPEIIQKVYLGVGTMLSADEARRIVNDAAGVELLPDGFVPTPKVPGVAAGRRDVRQSYVSVRAEKVSTWQDRVAEVLSTLVDTEAIAAAAVDGTAPADAVAAGLVTDTGPLASLLIELWGDGYGTGQSQATDAVPATAARRASVVVASLSDMVARAGEIASGILGSLADRLATALGRDDAPTETGGLAEILAAAVGDEAAAERIAVTEYHRSVVSGAVDTWASMGITETTWVRTSGSGDSDECADLDGTTSARWSSLPPLHPNCECLLEPA